MSGWAPEVYIPGEDKWHGNGLVFPTEEEAEAWARDLLGRWFVPTESRAVPTDREPNYRLQGNGRVELLGGPQDGAVVAHVATGSTDWETP